MEIPNWDPPPCPKCDAKEMHHKLFSHIPSSQAFRTKNGWYCGACKSGPYQLGGFSESDAAKFSVSLINR
ncbi:hypothetical protein ABCL16_003449 [Vibrio parahaemolyticus]